MSLSRREALAALAASSLWTLPSRGSASSSFSALLIGVAQYDNPRIPRLYGPGNDIDWMRRRLLSLGYWDSRITVLANGPSAPATALAPTGANIRAALAQAAASGVAGSSLWLHYSGHGAQTPALYDRDEADVLDEVLLPSDTNTWSPRVGAIGNAIRDDDIGRALDAIRARGVNVFAVFDCCYANTMTKDDDVPGMTWRCVEPESLGIPSAVTAGRRRRPGREVVGKGAAVPGLPGTGALVSLYATREDQRAPEMTLGADIGPDRAFGVLSWSICRALGLPANRTMQRLYATVDAQRITLGRGVPQPLLVDEGGVAGKLPFA